MTMVNWQNPEWKSKDGYTRGPAAYCHDGFNSLSQKAEEDNDW